MFNNATVISRFHCIDQPWTWQEDAGNCKNVHITHSKPTYCKSACAGASERIL